jgi:hypothetical protein
MEPVQEPQAGEYIWLPEDPANQKSPAIRAFQFRHQTQVFGLQTDKQLGNELS